MPVRAGFLARATPGLSSLRTTHERCPSQAGRVTVESGAFVGIGATVIQSVRVGYEAVVGAGAVVTTDVPPMSTVAGVPARVIKRSEAAHDSWLLPELARAKQIQHLTPPETSVRETPA